MVCFYIQRNFVIKIMLLNCLKHTGTAFALPVPINIDELKITNDFFKE